MTPNPHSSKSAFLATFSVLLALLCILFWRIFLPDYVVFSNDGPLGSATATAARATSVITGYWHDLNWLGYQQPAATPKFSTAIGLSFGPFYSAKTYALLSLLIAGLGAWFCFWRWKFSPATQVLGAVAAALNADFFSTACWGVASQPIAFGCAYAAAGLLAPDSSPRRWLRTVLGGFAVGMGVMEAFDNGAIFSLVVAAYIVAQPSFTEEKGRWKWTRALVKLGVVAISAAFIATHVLQSLVGTQIKGVAGMGLDEQSKEERWAWATQVSLPKREVLDIVFPGIFGYRIDTPDEQKYWGIASPGGGHYAGAMVLLGAVLALAQSLRRNDGTYSHQERTAVWFWGAVTFVALLLSFGKYAPFYQFFYMIPYASTIRNPAKFIHVFEWATVILFAYGIEGLIRKYTEGVAPTGQQGFVAGLRAWWGKATAFERKWTRGALLVLGAMLLGWAMYATGKDRVASHIQSLGFDAAAAEQMASFSVTRPGWTILFLAAAIVLFAAIMSRFFIGKRAKLAGVLLVAVLALDLARANAPWVVTYNWKQKYATDAVVDFLKPRSLEGRVTTFPLENFLRPEQLTAAMRPLIEGYQQLRGLYTIEWMQHHFQYYNIPSLDVVQMPRVPEDYSTYAKMLAPHPFRYWQLTSTRYLLAPAAVEQMAPNTPLKPVLRFDIVPKPGISRITAYEHMTAVANTNGQYAILEFTEALPRVALFSNWSVNTNDEQVLSMLRNPGFSPTAQVLVSTPIPPSEQAGTNVLHGKVTFASYAPKRVVLNTTCEAAAVVMLNDKYDPNWRVTVDGKPAELLRCNYIMRGVKVPAGQHSVAFVFQPSLTGFYISLVAIALALSLIIWLVVQPRARVSPPRSDC